MKEIRRYYSGEHLSATKLNDLVDALKCLCSEAKRLQKTRFTYGAQPINPERRYWAGSTEGGCSTPEEENWEECICVGERCIGTCRAAFEVVRWGATEQYYLTPGAVWNGIDMDQRSWARICNLNRPLYVKEGYYYTRMEAYEEWSQQIEKCRLMTSWGVRNGVLIMKNGMPTHRGGGAYTRGGYTGYGAVSINNTGKVRVGNLPYHLMSGGVDAYAGGKLERGVEVAQDYSFCNSIKVLRGEIVTGVPDWKSVCYLGEAFLTRRTTQAYPILFVTGTRTGISLDDRAVWMKLSGVENSGAIPCYENSAVKFWFCMRACGTFLRQNGFVEVKWSGETGRCFDQTWKTSVPVAYGFRNAYSGYVECVRLLEDEVIIQPTVYVTAPGGVVTLDATGILAMTEIVEADAPPDDGWAGGTTDTSCVAGAVRVSLPRTLSKQRFFPWGNVCSGFYTYCGCFGEEW